MEKLHIGQIIRQKVDEKGIKISQLSHRLNYTRRNIYDIFDRESVDSKLLAKISKILDYDFVTEYNTNTECVAVISTNLLKIKELELDNDIKVLFYKSV